MYEITLMCHDAFEIPLMQYDTNYKVAITLIESLQDKIAQVEIETAIGGVLLSKADVDVSNQIVSFFVDSQITFKPGKYKAQINLYDSNDDSKRLGYYPFILNVEKSVKQKLETPYEMAVSEVTKLVNEGYKLAESWAHGATGVREGEDTDNSKYYAEQSKGAYHKIEDTNEANLDKRLTALEKGTYADVVEIGTINHGLNDYPSLDGYMASYGAGIGGAGEGPAGGTSLVHELISWEHLDFDKTKISANKHVMFNENDVVMEVETINKINSNQYAVVFKGQSKNMLITLR